MSIYFVAPSGNGGNDSNPGTQSQPWLTGAKAASVMVAGDTTYFRSGTYGGWTISSKNGSSGAPITYANYSGETAILDPYIGGPANEFTRHWVSGDQKTSNLIQFDGICSYIVFDGFRIENSNPTWNNLLSLNLDNASDLSTYRSHDLDSRLHSGAFTINSTPNRPWPHHLVFKNLIINRMMGIWGGDMDSCQFLHNHISECRFDYVFYCTGSNYLVQRNIFEGSAYGLHFNGCSGPYGSEPFHYTDNSLIERNLFRDIGNRTWLFRTSNPAIVAWGGDAIYLCLSNGGNNVRNNIFANITDTTPRIDSGGNGIRWRGGGCNVFNNTFYSIGAKSVDSTGGLLLQNNIVTSWTLSGDTQSNNLIGVDPASLFMDANNGDYRLKSGSPAINAGIDLSAYFNTDFFGNARG